MQQHNIYLQRLTVDRCLRPMPHLKSQLCHAAGGRGAVSYKACKYVASQCQTPRLKVDRPERRADRVRRCGGVAVRCGQGAACIDIRQRVVQGMRRRATEILVQPRVTRDLQIHSRASSTASLEAYCGASRLTACQRSPRYSSRCVPICCGQPERDHDQGRHPGP